jgi:branched-chain amino acid transport system permease protein
MLIGFAFTEVVRLGATRIDYIGGNSGMVGIYAPQSIDPWMPALCVATCYLVVLGLYLLERSSFGLLLKATRNNEKVVESVGLSTLHIKLACFCTAAFAIGVAGSIHAYSYHVISPGDFGFLVPVYALAYVKVGGERHVLGAVIGACFLTVVAQMVQGTGSLQYIIFGGVIVITMLGLKGGILQLLSYALGLKKRRKRRNNADVLGEHAQGELR